jgi:hypothetical protein
VTYEDFMALPDSERLAYKPSAEELVAWQAQLPQRGPEQKLGPKDWLDLSAADWSTQRTDEQWAFLFGRFTENNWRYYWQHVQDASPYFRWTSRLQRQVA